MSSIDWSNRKTPSHEPGRSGSPRMAGCRPRIPFLIPDDMPEAPEPVWRWPEEMGRGHSYCAKRPAALVKVHKSELNTHRPSKTIVNPAGVFEIADTSTKRCTLDTETQDTIRSELDRFRDASLRNLVLVSEKPSVTEGQVRRQSSPEREPIEIDSKFRPVLLKMPAIENNDLKPDRQLHFARLHPIAAGLLAEMCMSLIEFSFGETDGDVRFGKDGALIYTTFQKDVALHTSIFLQNPEGREIWKVSERSGSVGFDVFAKMKNGDWKLRGTIDRSSGTSFARLDIKCKGASLALIASWHYRKWR
ncbi:uncharacterized protein BJ171DRAFT_475270 [Polychytrium aggregatum]|uniref:uncharacterized protein n=1 Tax=Polychytrium aggregatum TaxID=110093 RepID=UPI0022FDB490|nr:uncharacterized protein BJ171DRAFT_475270 [Polychytrium aggregatum]KAI9204305.1 hypothetical protein BJ171DRAFT_475270 [Polychytrium aggregatum]